MRTQSQILEALSALSIAHDISLATAVALFETDPELFFEVGVVGVPPFAPPWASHLLHEVRTLQSTANEPCELRPVDGATVRLQLPRSGLASDAPLSCRERIAACLGALSGRSAGRGRAHDYQGAEASEAEARFKLGEQTATDAKRAALDARAREQPMVFRIDIDDRRGLVVQPPYVTHELARCAKQVVETPRCVFSGIRREGGLKGGFAFVGKPRRAYGNDGKATEAPADMVYAVYTDADLNVFDWDWVEEDPSHAGYPVGWQIRFGKQEESFPAATLAGVEELAPGNLDPRMAWHSERGDCIFCYIDDAPGYAHRVNDDLTIFYARASQRHVVGCKIKNAARLCEILGNASAESVTLYGPGLSVTAVLHQSCARMLTQPQTPQHEVVRRYTELFNDLDSIDPRIQNPPDLEVDSLGISNDLPFSAPELVEERP